MASISANGSKGHHKFTLNLNETATSTENNTSTVSFSFVLSPVQTSWAWEQWGSDISYSITINGTKYSGTIPNYDGYATVTLKSGIQTVSHNADGTKSISYSFSLTDNAGQYYTPGNASASGTLALSTIPRATTPTLSATSVTCNGSNNVTINIAPASNTFKHKIRYAFGKLTGLVAGLPIGYDFTAQGNTSVKFTPPISLLNQIPSANSGVCTISLYTYTSSGTHIGTKTVNLTVNVPSYTPTGSISLTGNNLLEGIDGNKYYMQDRSTVTATISAASSYGATIKAVSSTVDNKTYSGNKFTTSVLSSGDKTVSVTLTDTRGKKATVTSNTFKVYEYAIPKVTVFTLARQSDGTTVIATVKGSISPVGNKNGKAITVTLNGKTNVITSSSYTIDATTIFTGVPTDNTFTGTARIADSYANSTKDFVLPTVAVTMDFHNSGRGVAFGKVAESADVLDVAWEIKTSKPEKTSTNLTFRGTNVVNADTDDTPTNWSTLGNLSTVFYNTDSKLTKPTSYGFMLNATNGASEVHQLWLEQVGGTIYHRGGNHAGFNPWRWILDSDNSATLIRDSGWVQVSYPSTSKFQHYNTTQPLRYRRFGKQVFINGAMKPNSSTPLAASSSHYAFTLPEGYRPSQLQDFLCQGSSANKWLCEITSAGVVSVARYGTTEFIDIPTTAWLPVCISFLLD
jgi:hypothetical protein